MYNFIPTLPSIPPIGKYKDFSPWLFSPPTIATALHFLDYHEKFQKKLVDNENTS